MATSVLNGLIIKASRMVQEMRTSAGAGDDTGRRWKSVNWEDYANRALRDLLRDKFEELGAKEFMQRFPEYVKPSGVITLAAGAVAKPTDALFVVDLVKSDLSLTFERLDPAEVESVRTGENGLYTPSATKPVFWEENGQIRTLGLTAGDVIAKCIVTPVDLAVITAADGAGKWNTAAGEYDGTTRLLTVTMNSVFTAADENRKMMIKDTTNVYFVKIERYSAGNAVYINETVPGYGGMPTGSIIPGEVITVLMEQVQDPDVLLKNLWHGELVERMVAYAKADEEGNALK